ncbi:MAG: hypothetical protein U1E53_09775 [Dongiaceae bacterium]
MATGRSSSARPGDDLLSQTAENWVGEQDSTFSDPALDSPANHGTASELQSQPARGDNGRRETAGNAAAPLYDHDDYDAWRRARLAALDEDYRLWRTERGALLDRGYGRWRDAGGGRFEEFPDWMDSWRDA